MCEHTQAPIHVKGTNSKDPQWHLAYAPEEQPPIVDDTECEQYGPCCSEAEVDLIEAAQVDPALHIVAA